MLQGSSAELRELAAEGLGELVDCTDEATLKPFVVQITGPLIRIIGDRFSWQVIINRSYYTASRLTCATII